MTVWRPPPGIRVKVLGLAWRGEDLLLAEVEDDRGKVKGVRPLGGTIEFGETREQALARELREELECEITQTGPWHAFENIYVHEGATGHEFIFAANVRLADPGFYASDRIRFAEDNGLECWARWLSPVALPPSVHLYPGGLLGLIEQGVIGPDG